MKKIVAGLLVAGALLTFGCSGRNADFGVVDLQRVGQEATYFQTTKENTNKELQNLQAEFDKEVAGKSEEESKKILEDYQAKAKLLQSEASNKMKASLDAALNQVAKEKGLGAILIKDVVPQGGTDVTEDVIAKIK